MKKFIHLHVPETWQHYWTKYPEGYTILESLMSWVTQVDNMVDQLNKNTLDIRDFIEKITDFINDFTDKFGEKLAMEVVAQLTEWLNDGTLADIITNEVLTTISNRIEKVEKTIRYINAEQPPGGLLPITNNSNNNVERLNAMIDLLKDGGELFIPSGSYPMEKPLKIYRPIRITGHSPYRNRGTSLDFTGTNGVEIFFSYVELKNITLKGTNKKGNIKPELKELGTVGLYNRYNNDGTSSGTKTENVSIWGFNVGYASVQENTEVWAGAYRENKGLYVSLCDIGVCLLDGATFESFIGGRIIECERHGLYVSLPNNVAYNRVEFIATCFEKCGYQGGNMDSNNMEKEHHGIYVKDNSKVYFTNCYFEIVKAMTKDSGYIKLTSCHVHSNFKVYGTGNSYSDSHGNHKQTIIPDLTEDYTFTKNACEVQATASTNFRVQVTSDQSGNVFVRMPLLILRGLTGNDLKWVKVNFRYRVKSGLNGSNFGLTSTTTVEATDNSTDNGNHVLIAPTQFLQPKRNNEYQTFEYYQQVRTGGSYVNPHSYLRSIYTFIRFYNISNGTNADYSADNLDIEISDFAYTIYTDKETSVDQL